MNEQLPNFFIIGAAKSGTTSLHEYLAQHPDIYMSFPKELNFFSFLESVPNFSGPCLDSNDPVLRDRLRREQYELSVTHWPDYRKVFARVRSEQVIGESSVSYLYFPQAAKRIRQCVPDARLVALLRHPVDRAYSKYRQLRRDGAEPLPLFEQALAAEIGRMQQNWSPAWFYVDRGFYYRQIGRYYELFDPRQIHVVLYDEFVRNPKQVLTRIFNFLNIDEKICIDVDHKYNVFEETNMPRSMFLYDSIVRPNWFSSKVRDVIPTGLLKYVRPIAKMAVTKKTNGPVISPLDQETRNKMIHLFREDILQLQDLINKDLSSWIGG